MKYLNYKKYERKRGLEAASSIHCMVMGSTRSPKISKLGFQNELDWSPVTGPWCTTPPGCASLKSI